MHFENHTLAKNIATPHIIDQTARAVLFSHHGRRVVVANSK